MSIIDKAQLLGFRNQTRTFSKGLSGSLNEFINESRIGKVTIFLSHKHDERTELDAAIQFLKKMNVNVYVDWLDDEMPVQTSGITASRIKNKIKENRKFIFLATEGAINSKWCNWELGIGDTHKYLNHIALLPIKENHRNYSGNEYLQIYPTIEFVRGFTLQRQIGGYFDEGYYVVSPLETGKARSYNKLEDWISN